MSDSISQPRYTVAKKAFIIGLLTILFCTFTICAYTYYVVIPKQAEARVTQALKTFGFEKISIGGIKRSNGKITFSNIVLDEKKFSTIESLTVRFSLWRFFINPASAQRIHIKNLHLTGELDQSLNMQVAGWDNANDIVQRLHTVPASSITIEHGRIDILSDTLGGVSIAYNAYVNLHNPKNIKFQSTISSRQKKLSFQSTLNGSIHAKNGIKLKGDIGNITFNHSNYSVKRGAGHLDLNYNESLSYSAEAQLSSASFYKLPLKDVRVTLDHQETETILLAEGQTFGPENLNWNSKFNLINGVTKSETRIQIPSTLELTQLIKRNDVFQNNIVFPWEPLNIEQPILSINTIYTPDTDGLTGSFEITAPAPLFNIAGAFNKGDDNAHLSGEFHLKETKIKSKNDHRDNFFDISSNGNFTINNLMSTPDMKWVAVTDIHKGKVDYGALSFPTKKSTIIYNTDNPRKKQSIALTLPLKRTIKHNAYIAVGLTDKNTPHIQSLNLEIYEGILQTQAPIFINGTLAKNNTITVSDISLMSLFKDFGLSNITASGSMSGLIPFEINKNAEGHQIEIKSGILQSIGTGRIQLPDDIIQGLFPDDTAEAEKKRAALKNFHYDYFELRLDGSLTGKVLITLNAQGTNPDTFPIKPIDINLQIESELSFLLKNLIEQPLPP